MKRILFTAIILVVSFITLKAQSWSGISGGIDDDPRCIASYNGELYVGGDFLSIDGVSASRIAKWDGTTWTQVGSGLNGDVDNMIVYDGKLVIYGQFDEDGSGTLLDEWAMWDGTNFTAMSYDTTRNVDDMVVYGGELYVTVNRPEVRYLAKWNGTSWDRIPGDFKGPTNYVWLSALEVWNGDLIIGGRFDSVGNIPTVHFAAFDGTNYRAMDAPLPARDGGILSGWVSDLTVFNGNLYAGGTFQNIGDTKFGQLLHYDNSNWDFYRLNQNKGGSFTDIQVFNNQLFCGGKFSYIDCSKDTVRNAVIFDSTSTDPANTSDFNNLNMHNPNTGSKGIFDYEIHNGELYAMGDFMWADDEEVFGLAKFDGTLPMPLVCDTSVNPPDTSNTSVQKNDLGNLKIYPNPANDILIIEQNQMDQKGASYIQFFDLAGKELHTIQLKHGKNVIQTSNLNSGMLIYQIASQKEVLSRGKLLILHN